MEEIVDFAEEADAAKLDAAVVRPPIEPTTEVLLIRIDCVVWRSMRLRMPQTLALDCLATTRIVEHEFETERPKECC